MKNLDIYCVTDKKLDFLEKTNLNLVGVGKEKFSEKYLKCDIKKNIDYKEKYYSELTFHYWYWKNILPNEKQEWIGFCQKRRFWINPDKDKNLITLENLNEFLLSEIDDKMSRSESFICNPINLTGVKKMKMIKRGWKNLIKDPAIFFNSQKHTISLHFDMHHGYNNLNKAINLLDRENKKDFLDFVNNKTYFNPHIMYISRPDILEKWFKSLFSWLERCESEFGFNNLKGYDTQRLYAYLAERYLSYWFQKYTKFKELPWTVIQI